MAGTDVKTLLLQVDASVELLRRNLSAGQARVDQFAGDTTRRLDAVDRRLGEFGRPLAGFGTSIAGARREIASLGASVADTENRIRSSAGGIKAALLASTSGVAAAFSVDRIKDYADGYTRYTNQLKVAGLEGAGLAKTQEQLFEVAQRYGIQLESVGTLYGRASQAGKALGASQADLIKFTNGVGAALKVQGGSAEDAQGALLQLGQLLSAGTVHAEEFNSVNEGARPILQAVANGIDKYKGSVAALRADVLAGTVTSQDFFQGFLKGSGQLEAQAAKANLTIGASFTILNNALGKYIGETDAGLSATARVSAAIVTLSNNLDVVAPALAVVGAGFAARFVAGPIAAVAGEVLLLTKALDAEKVVLIGGKVAAAQKAEAIAASARVEVAEIEATIAARRADQAALLEQIAGERALAAERRAAAVSYAAQNTSGGNRTVLLAAQRKAENDATFATDRLTAARQRLAVVDGELAVAEGALAGAQARSATATTASTAAATAATIASRAAAAASRLFAGALTLIGGSVAGGAAVLVIGALIAAYISMRDEAAKTSAELAAFAEHERTASETSKLLASYALSAGNHVATVGKQAATASSGVRSFAGAVGEAAEKLDALARARRRELFVRLSTDKLNAENDAAAAKDRFQAASGTFDAKVGYIGHDESARTEARKQYESAQQRSRTASASIEAAVKLPLANYVRETDRPGGRDVDGERARISRDLAIAQQGTNKQLIADLKAQRFELTQYDKYRKQGLSVDAANAASSKDASAFRDSTQQRTDRDASKAAGRAATKAGNAAAAEKRKEEVAARDAAGDARAYAAASRQTNGEIAVAQAELSGSIEARAKIEKDRIEAERQSRNEELIEQAKQGRFGVGDEAKQRVVALQGLNDQRAGLETRVVDEQLGQRQRDEQLAITQAGRRNQQDLLAAQSDLATTARQRRALELRILDIQFQEERARLDGVIASRDSSEAEKEIARQRKAILGDLQAAGAQSIKRQTAGPLDQYRERLRENTDDVNNALEGVAVDGLQTLQDGLVGLVNGTESVSSAFKKMAASIIADLAKIAIEKAIVSAIGGSFGGFAKGGKIEGRATGGRIEAKAAGGRISGPGTGTSDSILAMVDGKRPLLVSNGESIVTAEATARWWPVIDAMNKGTLQGFATGGRVGNTPGTSLRLPAAPQIAGVSAGGAGGTINVRVALSEDLNATIDNRAIGAAVEVFKAGAPQLVDAASAQTMAAIGRPTI